MVLYHGKIHNQLKQIQVYEEKDIQAFSITPIDRRNLGKAFVNQRYDTVGSETYHSIPDWWKWNITKLLNLCEYSTGIQY